MATLTGSEPISSDNLAAVLGSRVPEIAILNDNANNGTSVGLSRPASDFDILLLNVTYWPYANDGTRSTLHTTVMMKPGETESFLIGGVPYTFTVSGNTIVFTDGQTTRKVWITRVIGIRFGGGASPS